MVLVNRLALLASEAFRLVSSLGVTYADQTGRISPLLGKTRVTSIGIALNLLIVVVITISADKSHEEAWRPNDSANVEKLVQPYITKLPWVDLLRSDQ